MCFFSKIYKTYVQNSNYILSYTFHKNPQFNNNKTNIHQDYLNFQSINIIG